MKNVAVIFCLICLSSVLTALEKEIPMRPEIKLLVSDEQFTQDAYEEPYLSCQSGFVVKEGRAEVESRLVKALKEREIKARSHFSSTETSLPPWSEKSLPVADEWKTENELEGLQECDLKKCFPKLNDREEKPFLIRSKNKLDTYRSLVNKRVGLFLEKQRLLGYEDRKDNKKATNDLFKFSKFLKTEYPGPYRFLTEEFWRGGVPESSLTATVLRSQKTVLGTKQLQPIYWVGEIFQFKEKTRSLFVEMVIYSNHYFDSWVRVYEVYDLTPYFTVKAPRTGVILTDLTEIDELKKSTLIRSLFKGNMVEAILKAQSLDFKSIQ